MTIIKQSVLTSIALSSAACFIVAGGSVFADAGSTSPNTSTNAQTQQATLLQKMKSKGGAEINRRINSLTSAESKISSTTKLSTSDQASLENEVSGEINGNNNAPGLKTLLTTLNGETIVSAAKTDIQNIFNEYRVYALVLPKVRLVVAADGEIGANAKLSTLATNLQTRITADQNAGKNVTTLQNDLNDMNTQISNAKSIATTIETNVINLQPSDYNSAHTILSGDAAQLKTAHSDNSAAATDAKNIISGLKALE